MATKQRPKRAELAEKLEECLLALHPYLWHAPSCPIFKDPWGGLGECNCGLEDARRKLREVGR